MSSWPDVDGIAYGGDYNPEQWPEEVWAEDVRLMREAGVNLVTVGVFSWALLEPEPGRYELGWLDRVLDLLHDGGVAVDLATATASPPPWLSAAHPESLPVRADGTRLWWGSRQAFCPSSPHYRQAARRLVETLGARYSGHPAVRLWHAHNEYGCHNAHCYCDTTAAAFRRWLQRRYGDLDRLNEAWSTAFWSQRYGDWSQVLPPRQSTSFGNPTQQLDFWRFSSDELLDCLRAEREVLHRCSPGVPVTTNFMAAFKPLDYWAWSREVDVVSTDHYPWGEAEEPHLGISFAADVTRSLAGGGPWLLMEHSPSAVNWQPRNLAKPPGGLRRDSLTHLARGADGLLFFQWRASTGGAEKFHAALVPHAGTDSKVWREAVALGRDLRALAEVRGSRVRAEVALVLDWDSWWATDLDAHPSVDVRHLSGVLAWYRALWRLGVTTDLVHPGGDLGRYRAVLAPALYLVDDDAAAALRRYVEDGGTLAVGFFSGIADRDDRVRLGGYPGAFRDLLGVRVEEFFPLPAGETVPLSDGSTGRVWSELGRSTGAEVLAAYAAGPTAGCPALTRHPVGAGTAWYAGTALGRADLGRWLRRVLADSGVQPPDLPPGLEVVRRDGADASYVFVINHAAGEAALAVRGRDLLAGADVDGLRVPAGGVAVVRTAPAAPAPAPRS